MFFSFFVLNHHRASGWQAHFFVATSKHFHSALQTPVYIHLRHYPAPAYCAHFIARLGYSCHFLMPLGQKMSSIGFDAIYQPAYANTAGMRQKLGRAEAWIEIGISAILWSQCIGTSAVWKHRHAFTSVMSYEGMRAAADIYLWSNLHINPSSVYSLIKL